MAETKSAFIALLTSHHIQFLHGEDAMAKNFINKLREQEKNWLRIPGSSADEVGRGYELLP